MHFGLNPMYVDSASSPTASLAPAVPTAATISTLPEGDRKARIGSVVFIHRFGVLMNAHLHLHVIVIDGMFCVEDDAVCVFGRRAS